MEKRRKTKMIVIISLLVAVVGLSVAYAAMSGLLSINGSANVDAANWDIHFANLSEAKTKGEASEKNRPNVAENGASITNINVSLNNPKDEVVYDVDLVNEGSINAEISNIVMPTFTEEQEKYLDFRVTYKNDGTELAIGDLLNKGQTKKVTITIKYRDDLDEEDLPDEKQSITLSYELTYTQTDKEEVTTEPIFVQSDLFIWSGPTMISGLTEKGIKEIKQNEGHLIIPEGVTEITDAKQVGSKLIGGFSPIYINDFDMTNSGFIDYLDDPEINFITKITFPSTLTKIGNMTFSYCTRLTGELYIPDSVVSIGLGAFAIDSNLTINKIASISISKNTTYEDTTFIGRPTPTVRD